MAVVGTGGYQDCVAVLFRLTCLRWELLFRRISCILAASPPFLGLACAPPFSPLPLHCFPLFRSFHWTTDTGRGSNRTRKRSVGKLPLERLGLLLGEIKAFIETEFRFLLYCISFSYISRSAAVKQKTPNRLNPLVCPTR